MFVHNPNLYQCALRQEIEQSLSKNALNALKQDLVIILPKYDYYQEIPPGEIPDKEVLPELIALSKLMNANLSEEQKDLIRRLFQTYNELENSI